jgi:hypothetical protein
VVALSKERRDAMKRVTILMAALMLAALVTGAPAAWAGETSPPAAIGVPGLEPAAPAVTPPAGASAPAPASRECAGLGAVADGSWTCGLGAPKCTYNGACTSWCSPYGTGLCVSGCCACVY